MNRNFLVLCVALLLLTPVFGQAPKDLEALKSQFEKSPQTEADRQQYITGLAKLRGTFAQDRKDSDWQAVDTEIRSHPAPKDSDSKALSALLVGKWDSPRHEYAFKKDGTWVMLPEEPEATHGKWRIEGNQYFDTAAVKPPGTTQYTIILLTKKYFIFTNNEVVFYETRE